LLDVFKANATKEVNYSRIFGTAKFDSIISHEKSDIFDFSDKIFANAADLETIVNELTGT